MNHKLAFTAAALALFSFGCNEGAERNGQAEADAHTATDHEHAEEGGSLTSTATLDSGHRWKANPETTAGIANMAALIDKQVAAPGDAKAAKAALEEEFALIFERCTMTGEAHNQLHNYLIPIHQRLSELDAGDASQLAGMKTYLGTYGNYFE